MPFKKVGDNDYTSPTGRHFNGAQVRLYYANGGHFPGEKMKYAKGGSVQPASYAEGGPVLGRTRDFMKEPDPFRDDEEYPPAKRRSTPEDQAYGKKGVGGSGHPNPKAADKSEKPVRPRS